MAVSENKTPYRLQASSIILWCFFLVLASSGICWYYTKNLTACLDISLAVVFLLFFFWFDFFRRAKKGLFIELQFFLMRCHIFSDDFKIFCNPLIGTLEKKKQEPMDLASERFQQKG